MSGAHYPNQGRNKARFDERNVAQNRRIFIEFKGESDAEHRACEIDALPIVEWKGKRLRTIRCHGTSGKGPHDCNVPEGLLWSLISLRRYFCVYHAGDACGSLVGYHGTQVLSDSEPSGTERSAQDKVHAFANQPPEGLL